MWRLIVLCGVAAGCRDDVPAAPPPSPRVASSHGAPPRANVSASVPDAGAWTRSGAFLSALAFCPGDTELVAIDEAGWLTRWRVSDGARIGATALTATDAVGLAAGAPPPEHPPATWKSAPPRDRVDCRDDGTALAVGVLVREEHWDTPSVNSDGKKIVIKGSSQRELTIPFLVDRAGAARRPSKTLDVIDSRFSAQGDARLLTIDTRVLAWRDSGALDEVFASERDSDAALGAADDIVEYDGDRGMARLRRGDQWIALGKTESGFRVETVPDGVLIQTEMAVHVWTLKNGKASKPKLLLDATGVHVKATAAGKKWFLAVDANSELLRMKRPSMKIDTVKHPCSKTEGDGVAVTAIDRVAVTAIALSRDEMQLAVACTDGRIRLIRL